MSFCCLRSVINRVICTSLSPPSSFFSPLFFLFFQSFLLERVQVDGRFLLLLSDARLHPSKKIKFSNSHQSHLVPLQPQTPLTTSAKLLKRSFQISPLTSSFHLNPAASHLTTPTPFVADSLSWRTRRQRLIWIRSSTVCWKVGFTHLSFPSPSCKLRKTSTKRMGMDCAQACLVCRSFGPRGRPMPSVCHLVGNRLLSTTSPKAISRRDYLQESASR